MPGDTGPEMIFYSGWEVSPEKTPEHRPVHFHSSKVLLWVKFISTLSGCLGMELGEEAVHENHGLTCLILGLLVFKASRVILCPG